LRGVGSVRRKEEEEEEEEEINKKIHLL